MRIETRPLGGVAPVPERPAAPTPVAGVGAIGAPGSGAARAPGGHALPGAGVAASALRDGTLDLPQALRVYAEELRGLAVERLGTARADGLPQLPPDSGADVGNTAALLLRWLRTAAQAAGAEELPWTRLVDLARARTERVAAGAALDAALRNALATARDALLRGLASGPPGGGGRGLDAAAALAVRPPLPDPGSPRTSADAAARIVDAGRSRGAPDVGGALRLYAEELRGLVLERIGGARTATLPPLPLDRIGADADEAATAVARWLRAAGVVAADWPGTVQAGHARAEAALARAALEPSVRDALALARDLLVRGLAGFPDGEAAAPVLPGGLSALPDPVLLRPDLALLAPYGSAGRGRGTDVPRAPRDRVEAVGEDARRRRGARATAGDDRDDRGAAGAHAAFDDDPFARAASGGGLEPHARDLQGPMDCIRRYVEADHAGDSAACAALSVYPACVWAGGRWTSYPDAAAWAAAHAAHARAAREAGMAGGRIVMLRVEPISEDAACVHCSFAGERADGSVFAEIECAYTAVRTADGWRVAACIVK